MLAINNGIAVRDLSYEKAGHALVNISSSPGSIYDKHFPASRKENDKL